jgi:RNA polymerase sigma factor (sigma-70 family)
MRSPPGDPLDGLSTSWTLLEGARNHNATPAERREAQNRLIIRYERVVRSYLAGGIRRTLPQEPNIQQAVDDCFGDFGILVTQGLDSYDANRGHFRVWLRSCLRNLVINYWRKNRRRPLSLDNVEPPLADPPPLSEEEESTIWRDEYIRRALLALERIEHQTRRVLFSVLKPVLDAKANGINLSHEQLAEQLSRTHGQTRSAAWVGGRLHRARKRFLECLRNEVRLELPMSNPTDEQIDAELAEVGLLGYFPLRRPKDQSES